MCFDPVPVLCSLKRDESGFLGALPASPAADDMQTEEKVVESPPHSRGAASPWLPTDPPLSCPQPPGPSEAP